MKSRFIVRIEELTAVADSPAEVLCLSLEKASYLARRGDHTESGEIVDKIREQGQHLLNGKIGAWINFAEGMQLHCLGRDYDAKIKWSRCLAIARSANANQVAARASAWLAFVDYTNLNIESLITNTREALCRITDDNFEVSARVSLTAAQVFHLCGDFQRARTFYNKCRLACVSYCDDIMLSALMHNMAWLRVSAQRNAALQGFQPIDDGYIVEAAAESTKSYENLVGSRALDVMTPLLGAQVDILFGRYANAIRIIGEKLNDLRAQGLSRLSGVLIADRAYCHAKNGELEGARLDAIAALEAIAVGDHIDDLAVLHSRLSSVYEILGDLDNFAKYYSRSRALWQEYRLLQEKIILEVSGLPGFI